MLNKKTLIIAGILFSGIVANSQAALPADVLKTLENKKPDYRSLSIRAPEIAENGATVNIKIKKIAPLSQGEYIRQLSFYSDFRKTKPIAQFNLGPASIVDGMKLRVRMRETGNVYVVAKLNSGRVWAAEKKVKITIGGCGGTVNNDDE